MKPHLDFELRGQQEHEYNGMYTFETTEVRISSSDGQNKLSGLV